MVLNKKMQKILNEKNFDVDVQLIEETCLSILSKIKRLEIYDCIIYDEHNRVEECNLDYNLFEAYGGLSGFEMWYNEILINLYFKYDKRSLGSVINHLLECFKTAIKNKYPDKQFCVVIYENSDNLFLRFHVYRESEGLWIGENLEECENPTLYEVV